MDKVELFNEVIKIAKPAGFERPVATSLDQELFDLGLDSLDILLLSVYLADIYGVSEELLKQLKPTVIDKEDGTKVKTMTLANVYEFMEQHKTLNPTNVSEALQKIK